MRRDYEFALQIATKPVWDSFINKYSSGFYTDLAKAQRDKLAAEAARIEATSKAKAAQEEQARLAIEGAKAAEQTKAAEQAKAAEKARVAAELAKKAEEAKVAEAERAKTAAIAKAGEEAKVAEAERVKTAEAAKAAADPKIAPEQRTIDDKVATLTPPADKSDQQTVDLPRSLQSELRRVGCHTGSIDSNWNAASQWSLDLFNKHTGMKLEIKVASVDALDAVKSKPTRVCPLICDHGFRADGDRCIKITCRAGYDIGDDNTCEKIEVKKPTAKRDDPKAKRESSERTKVDAAPPKPQASGQIICNTQGCRPVQKGCHLGDVKQRIGSATGEVCD